MVGYKWVLKYIITNNLAAPALAPHGTINNDVIYVGTLKLGLTASNFKNSFYLAIISLCTKVDFYLLNIKII